LLLAVQAVEKAKATRLVTAVAVVVAVDCVQLCQV
jgi:hypothetical protein